MKTKNRRIITLMIITMLFMLALLVFILNPVSVSAESATLDCDAYTASAVFCIYKIVQ